MTRAILLLALLVLAVSQAAAVSEALLPVSHHSAKKTTPHGHDVRTAPGDDMDHDGSDDSDDEDDDGVVPPAGTKRVVKRKCIELRCRKCLAKCTVRFGRRAHIKHAVHSSGHHSDSDDDDEEREKDAKRDQDAADRRRSGKHVGVDKTDGGRDHRIALERRKGGNHSVNPFGPRSGKPTKPRRGFKDLMEAIRRRGLICKGLPCKTCKKACVLKFGTDKVVYKHI